MALQNSDASSGMNFKETELTLGLPGECRLLVGNAAKTGSKRGFTETVHLSLGNPAVACGAKAFAGDQFENNEVSSPAKTPQAKTQVVGWPPVRVCRINTARSCKFVKVAADGAPYLRKVDLEMYNSYQQLLSALEDMFSCLTIRDFLNGKKTMDQLKGGGEYVPAYEDKDGDWMMIGDVPWKMFAESCKRLRLLKITEAVGLGPRTL